MGFLWASFAPGVPSVHACNGDPASTSGEVYALEKPQAAPRGGPPPHHTRLTGWVVSTTRELPCPRPGPWRTGVHSMPDPSPACSITTITLYRRARVVPAYIPCRLGLRPLGPARRRWMAENAGHMLARMRMSRRSSWRILPTPGGWSGPPMGCDEAGGAPWERPAASLRA